MKNIILQDYIKDLPEGSQILAISPSATAEELAEALGTALGRMESNLRVIVYDSTICPARPYVCHKCNGSGEVEVSSDWIHPQYGTCAECNGKGMILP